MLDLVAAFGLALVLEGLLWALAPGQARRMLQTIAELPDRQLASAGWMVVAAGAAIVWLVRG